MRLALMCVPLGIAAFSAVAQDDFPFADVEGNCSRTMKRQPFIGECLRREQPAYDLARSLWNDLTPEAKASARKWESRPGALGLQNPAYYQNLLDAIMYERERQRIYAPAPRFRY